MKIGLVFLGNVSEDTGGRNYLINFTKAIAKYNREQSSKDSSRAHHFTVYLNPNQKFLIEKYIDAHFTIVEIPPSSKSSVAKVISEQLILPFYLLKSGLDVVYFPGNFVSLFSPKKTVVAIRSMLYYHYPEAVDSSRRYFRKFLTPPSAKRSRAIITPSNDIKNDVVNFVGIDPKKIHVVNHGVDTEMFQKNYLDSERDTVFKKFGISKKFILYASALWEYKNQDKLILAFEQLVQHGFDFQLVIAGQGINAFESYLSRLKNLVQEKKLQDRVIFAGLVPHQELKYLYKNAELFAYPSGYESFGNPLFEAWAAGVPIVSSDVHSFPEMTEHGKCAVMIKPENIDEFSAALQRVCTDQRLRETLIQNGYARVATFSWEKCVRETLDVLTKSVS